MTSIPTKQMFHMLRKLYHLIAFENFFDYLKTFFMFVSVCGFWEHNPGNTGGGGAHLATGQS